MSYTRVPVIISTDFASDIGDTQALSVAAALHNLGWVEILAVVVDSTDTHAPGAVNALFHSRGIDAPVGCNKGAALNPSAGAFCQWIYDNYSHPQGNLASTFPDAVDVIHTALTARTKADVVLVGQGFFAVWEQYRVAHSATMVAACDRLHAMAGKYPSDGTTEWNFQHDPANASSFCANNPIPIYFSGFAEGNTIIVGSTTQTRLGSTDLIRGAFFQAGYTAGRESWDCMPITAVVNNNEWSTTHQGTNVVNSSTGVNTFTAGAGTHYYVTKVFADTHFQKFLEDLCSADPTTGLTAWASGQGYVRAAVT